MKKFCNLIIFVTIIVTLCNIQCFVPISVHAEGEISFSGKGTKDSPYLIQNADDLKKFRDVVNSGNKFENTYFLQTVNIDLKAEDWTPIGVFGGKNYFYGIYDGGGHYIENLAIMKSGNNGLFGMLGGVVMNLGIESGEIHGGCIGAFTSHAAGDKAVIINCYNKATIYGGRGGGIADNFNGIILNCWTDCEILAKEAGDIYSFDCTRMLNCYTNNGDKNEVTPEALNSTLINSAAKAEIGMSELCTWSSDEDSVKFSGERYKFSFSDFSKWVTAYSTWIIFGTIVLAAVVILMYEFIRKNKASEIVKIDIDTEKSSS